MASSTPIYVLEEMLDWVREQQRELRRWGWSRPFFAKRRAIELTQRESTIGGNLGDAQEVWERINRPKSAPSYGGEFHNFVDQCRREAEQDEPKKT